MLGADPRSGDSGVNERAPSSLETPPSRWERQMLNLQARTYLEWCAVKARQSECFEAVGALFLTEGKLLLFFLTGKSCLGKGHLGRDRSEVQETSWGYHRKSVLSRKVSERQACSRRGCSEGRWGVRVAGSRRALGQARHGQHRSVGGEGVQPREPVSSSALLPTCIQK